ncbi:molecular chaperone HtpG [Haliangium ochraceum]|uniref:Chaperone protein HtpG n=1 Tax=Haliangium ochraceum (strain DSM 14365 / JCM 11303 / SMP-2) TaxID=502025 RepID=D0LYJ5_HALO1|nr:molecular chaperone HtpG [Haliangium ochraceum]ACY17861.1 Heat shock protein Hsp90-like protein [Haliangium ochraceum DSM 14365]
MATTDASAPQEGQAHYEFRAETQQLLRLMIHSLYSNKEIFLRELISNASDALDKLRFAALTDQSLVPEEELHIRIEIDAEARSLTVHDNGIGMSREDAVQNLGTIAKSGTQEFMALLEQAKDAKERPDLIGQFGVGFYASFLVADRVVVLTRKAGEVEATRWESDGVGGSYTVEAAERPQAGTSVTLMLKPADDEDGIQDYTKPWVVESIVRKYSDFVSYPIKMKQEAPPLAKPDEEAPPAEPEDKVLNSMKAIWTRSPSDVQDEEYKEFYKHISHDWNDPLTHLTTSLEGTLEAKALLYIPSRAPFDLFRADAERRGVQLYVRRVFIMDDCKELLPNYLRFVRGVVDSEDLPLNVSREILQQNRQIRAIRKHLVKKILDALANMKKGEGDDYLSFWKQFGAVLKEGLLLSQERNERIYELLLAESSNGEAGALVSLGEYSERMKEGQEAIYYLTAPSVEQARKSPHLEAFQAKGVEVLFFTDAVDEIWLQERAEYEGKKFQSVVQGDIQLGTEEEKKEAEEEKQRQQNELGDLLLAVRAALQEEVKEVRLSSRLTSSPACLVTGDGDLSPQLERIMRATGQEVPKVKRVLEVNPTHPVVKRMQEMHEASKAHPDLPNFSRLLYGQAILSEGGELEEPAEFAKLIAEVMVKVSVSAS